MIWRAVTLKFVFYTYLLWTSASPRDVKLSTFLSARFYQVLLRCLFNVYVHHCTAFSDDSNVNSEWWWTDDAVAESDQGPGDRADNDDNSAVTEDTATKDDVASSDGATADDTGHV